MAQAGDADFLVTGDKHDLLALGKFGRTAIITARQLLEKLDRRLPKRRSPPGTKEAKRRGPRAK